MYIPSPLVQGERTGSPSSTANRWTRHSTRPQQVDQHALVDQHAQVDQHDTDQRDQLKQSIKEAAQKKPAQAKLARESSQAMTEEAMKAFYKEQQQKLKKEKEASNIGGTHGAESPVGTQELYFKNFDDFANRLQDWFRKEAIKKQEAEITENEQSGELNSLHLISSAFSQCQRAHMRCSE